MTDDSYPDRKLSNRIVARVLPQRFIAEQLRRPSGRFGRWVVTRALNDGNAELIGVTLAVLGLGGRDRFLDVGFGGGHALETAARTTLGPLWGVDFAPDMVVAGNRRLSRLVASGRLNLLHADVEELPLRDGLVDAVCTTNTIYFWEDFPRALSELRRVLAPGGELALGNTGRAKLRRFDAITRHGCRMFEPREVEQSLSAAGFLAVTSTPLTGSLTRGDYVTQARV